MKAFQIECTDNVATALEAIKPGAVYLHGDAEEVMIEAVTEIPAGHKIALKNLGAEEDIVKYGVVIGRTTMPVVKGTWVHLHNMHSLYDERSGHLDVLTGAPRDIRYE